MARIVVLDTETTGLGPADQVIEVATVSFRGPDPAEMDWWSTLVRPTCPVTMEARAVHHVGDDELAEQRTMAELLADGAGLPELADGKDVVLAGHNLAFDVRMLTQSGYPEALLPRRRLCTWRCALGIWPDAPRHTNQVLRYHLGLAVPDFAALPPHRALPDALVTACLAVRCMAERTLDELVAMSGGEPVLLSKVTFGKNKGRAWREMDDGFLRWVLSRDFDADAKHTARYWLEQRAAGKLPSPRVRGRL